MPRPVITNVNRATKLAAVAALAAAGVVAATPAGALAVYHTKPTGLTCMTYNAQAGTGVARLGATNTGTATDNIPAGDFNSIAPDPIDRGQPQQFSPGLSSWDFGFTAGAPDVSWYINGLPATVSFKAADLPFDRPCPERGPSITAVAPTAVAPGSGPQRLTIFGQGLKGASVSLSGSGVPVTAPSAATEQRIDATVTVAAGASTGTRDVLVMAPDGTQVGCRGCLMVDPNAAGSAGPKGDTGPQGPAGPKGDTGPQGPAGRSAVTSVSHVAGNAVALTRSGAITAVASCPAGSSVISGGYEVTGSGAPPAVNLLADHAQSDRQWAVTIRALGPVRGRHVVASATCLR
jgi:hypothetical protein